MLKSRNRADFRVNNCIIARPATQKCHISKVKYRYQITRYCQLLNKQKHIVGCCKGDFVMILLTPCKFRSLIWIYRWTCRQPANSDGVVVVHGTVPEWAVRVYWQHGPSIWQRCGLDTDLDAKSRSGTVANATCMFEWSWPPGASPNPVNQCLHVYIHSG